MCKRPLPDEQFLHQVMDIIEKNMANPDFSVEEMSKGVFMSRVARIVQKDTGPLHGKTPIEFYPLRASEACCPCCWKSLK